MKDTVESQACIVYTFFNFPLPIVVKTIAYAAGPDLRYTAERRGRVGREGVTKHESPLQSSSPLLCVPRVLKAQPTARRNDNTAKQS